MVLILLNTCRILLQCLIITTLVSQLTCQTNEVQVPCDKVKKGVFCMGVKRNATFIAGQGEFFKFSNDQFLLMSIFVPI